jgi:hypothetical protein
MTRNTLAGLMAVATLVLFFSPDLRAQQVNTDNKEIRTLKLRLKQAELALTEAEASFTKADATYKDAQALFQKGLYSKIELATAEESYRRAELEKEQVAIELEKTRLAFLSNALYISLEKATLYRDANGDKHALLIIKNSSNVGKVIDEGGTYSDEQKRALLGIDNLTVRILLMGQLIGRPFEYKVPRLDLGQSRSVDFVLQKETETVTVQITYGDTMIQLPVFLEREAKEDRVLVQATQFSQEGELSTRVNYEVGLERFVDDDKSFSLELLNLPGTYSYEFRQNNPDNSGSGDNRISRLRFKKGTTNLTVQLIVSMPKEVPKEALGQKISFYVLVIDRFAQQRLATMKAKLQGRAAQKEDLDSAGLSFETLELIPVGKAEITIDMPNAFKKVKLGDPVPLSFTLENTGTVALDQIRISIGALPTDWTATITPEKNIALDVDAKKRIDVELIPSSDVVAGDYEPKIEAKTLHEGKDVEAIAKPLRIEIEGKSNFLIGAILMLVLIGMIVGVAVMTIKISRR